MKAIICGPRDIPYNAHFVRELETAIEEAFLQKGISVTEIVEGGCWSNNVVLGSRKGVDCYAINKGIDNATFWANWEKWGKSAGPIRNNKMAEYVQSNGGCIALCKPEGSKGTNSMIKIAENHNIPVYKHILIDYKKYL